MMIRLDTTLGVHRFETEQEANAFRDGFCEALDTYGIYKDGVITIGCLERPVKEIKAKLVHDMALAVLEARINS